MNLLTALLAQTTSPSATPPAANFLLPALMVAAVVFLLMTSRSQRRREQRERDEMHARLAKNDRVLTVGGIIGTVMSIKDTEVVLKVDETTNTKMTFLKSAVQRVLTDDQSAASDKR